MKPVPLPDDSKEQEEKVEAEIEKEKAKEREDLAKNYWDKNSWVEQVQKQVDKRFSMEHWKWRKTYKIDDDPTMTEEDSMWLEKERQVRCFFSEELFNTSQIYYSPYLTTAQRALVRRRFRRLVDEIKHSRFMDIPIIFSHKTTFGLPSKTPGFLCIPHTFDVEDLQNYLKLYVPT